MKDEHRVGLVMMTVSVCGALAVSVLSPEASASEGGKEAVGFDEVLPAEPEELEEKAPVRQEERPARRDVRRFGVRAGVLLAGAGETLEYDPSRARRRSSPTPTPTSGSVAPGSFTARAWATPTFSPRSTGTS